MAQGKFMAAARWKQCDDLYRGDQTDGVCVPDPAADKSIVRHILYLEGKGRKTPYLSATEDRKTAETFAEPSGQVYLSNVSGWPDSDVAHISRDMLMQLLRGTGRGRASSKKASLVMTARNYVERHKEHLADFSKHETTESTSAACQKIFTK